MNEFLLLATKRALIQILPMCIALGILNVRVLKTQGRMQSSQAEGGMWSHRLIIKGGSEPMRSLERQKEMREKTGNMTDFKKNLDKFLSH